MGRVDISVYYQILMILGVKLTLSFSLFGRSESSAIILLFFSRLRFSWEAYSRMGL
jgi:hypothetical protein